MKSEIHPLFATPIYRSRLERQFTNNEIKFVKDQINFCYKNTGNMSSNNTYILKVKELESIKIFIEECIKDYFEKEKKKTKIIIDMTIYNSILVKLYKKRRISS